MLVVLLCLLVTVRTQYEELVKEQGSENLITRSEELDITRSEELDITEAQGILTEIEEIFRELLSSHDEVLVGEEYEYRLGTFLLNVLSDKDSTIGYYTGPSLNDMYTEEEQSLMNGAVMEEDMEWKKSKRTKRSLFSIRTRPVYDTRRYFKMNTPTAQGLCGNCYVHAMVGALEIAYTKLTGELVKFSEQELTDCYYRGCRGGDYRMVAKTLAVTDHLAAADKYGPYLSGKSKRTHTCKAGVSPDALIKVKVIGVVEVTTETVEAAVTSHGSVMVCLDWKNECKDIGRYTEGVYSSKGTSNGCHHAALIVGYTPDYYIVRNSMGVSYGEDGYFKIKRGQNSCGIEQHMASLVVEERNSPKGGLALNGCPIAKPYYCTQLYVCTALEVECVDPEKLITTRRKRVPPSQSAITAITAKRNKREIHKREIQKREIHRSSNFDNNRIADVLGHRILKDHAKYGTKACLDNSKLCSVQKRWCAVSQLVPRLCPVSCGICKETSAEDLLASVQVDVKELKGRCNVPVIKNGRVIATGDTIPTGEYLTVECEPGFILEGERVRCVIQDVFSPDSRLLPECVKAGPEVLVGNGEHYEGTQSVDIQGRPCKAWNKQILMGYVTIKVAQSNRLVIGNHNLCRNVGGKMPVPWCYIDNEGNTGFCFEHPGCDHCKGAVQDTDRYCSDYYPWECDYSEPKTMSRPNDRWKHCKKTCCSYLNC